MLAQRYQRIVLYGRCWPTGISKTELCKFGNDGLDGDFGRCETCAFAAAMAAAMSGFDRFSEAIERAVLGLYPARTAA